MKKILLQLDSDKYPSVFDQVVAYDAGVDNIISIADINAETTRDLVYGLMFTRGGKDLKNSAVFVGGSDIEVGEKIFKAVQDSFFGPISVSVMLDSNGSNTTAAAAVRKIVSTVDVEGKKAFIMAGTGPVGRRAAVLLAEEGCDVTITSRNREKAQKIASQISEKFGVNISGIQVKDSSDLEAVRDAEIILSTGGAGIELVPQDFWQDLKDLKVVADVNAVPPLGIGGIKVNDDGEDYSGVLAFGAIGIGNLKMKIHKRAVKKLFESNKEVLGFKEIYALSKGL